MCLITIFTLCTNVRNKPPFRGNLLQNPPKMDDDLNLLIEEAILLEQNVADLYLLFYRLFPQDSRFWWKLSLEEQNHAALLKTVFQMKETRVKVPEDFLPTQLKALKEVNQMLQESMSDMEDAPDRVRAFHLSYAIENSAGERHYDAFMKQGTKSPVSEVFRKLNGDDIDHAARILQYMKENHIEPPEY